MIANYVGRQWVKTHGEALPVLNPATGEELGRTPLSAGAELDAAVTAAAAAFPTWRRVPVTERVQYLFKLKALLEEQLDDTRRHHHAGVRQDAGRVARRAAPRDRERRGRVRHAHRSCRATTPRTSPPASTRS